MAANGKALGTAALEVGPDPFGALGALALGHPPGERHQDVLHLERGVQPGLPDGHDDHAGLLGLADEAERALGSSRVTRSSAHTISTLNLPMCVSARTRLRLGDTRSTEVAWGQIADIAYDRGGYDEAPRPREVQLPAYEQALFYVLDGPRLATADELAGEA